MRFDILKCYQELKEVEGDNEITMRLGKTGSGKTLVQTEFDVLPLLLDEQEVWCCYFINLDLPNLHYFKPREFDKIKDLRNSTIVFDEIRRSFDPRQYADESEEFRSFVELHRHRHNNIIGNTQDISLVAKTFGIQTHNWSQVAKYERPIWSLLWDKIREKDQIIIQEDFLTYQELKKMANGWEIGEDVALQAEWQKIRFDKIELLHRELNDKKIELAHRYCPKCKSRQGERVLKADTDKVFREVYKDNGELKGYELIEVEYCPKHKNTRLIGKESGIFDTDYEPEVAEENKNIRIVKYQTCEVCGKDHIIK